jgi:transposase
MPLPRHKKSIAKPRRLQAAGWAWLEQRLTEAEGEWHVDGEPLSLPNWQTVKYYETANDIIVIADPISEIIDECGCSAAASTFQRWGLTAPTYVHDLPVRCKRVRIYFRRQRYRCACGKTFQPPLSGLDERHALTIRLARYIEREAFNIFRTFSGIADEVGVSEQLVRNIFTTRGELLEKDRCIETPRWLAIDEVHAGKHEYGVLTDPVRRSVIDLLPKNEQMSLGKCLLQLPDRHSIEVVTIDMYRQYRMVVQKLLPQAKIVVDRYHVHNLLSVALKHVLQVIRDGMTYSEQRQHMRYEHLLLQSRYHLSDEMVKARNGREKPSTREVVKSWLEDVPDIATAYWLKEEFSDILQLTDRPQAEERTDLWLEEVWEFVKHFRAKYQKAYRGNWEDPFGNVPETISEWRPFILNYIDYKNRFEFKATNAFAELVNGRIKRAYRLCSGLTYEVLRMKAIYGGVLLKRRPLHPCDSIRPCIKRSRTSHKNRKHGDQKSPNANVVRLERARKHRDATKDLLPKPQEKQSWIDRFGDIDQLRLGFDADEHEGPPRRCKGRSQGKAPKQPDTTNRRRSRNPLKYNRDQMKMF